MAELRFLNFSLFYLLGSQLDSLLEIVPEKFESCKVTVFTFLYLVKCHAKGMMNYCQFTESNIVFEVFFDFRNERVERNNEKAFFNPSHGF